MSQLEQFYDQWYQHGYMDEWPAEKKERVFQLIKELHLPPTGRLLDFGCGNGVFTAVLKAALPGWEVYGSDLSKVAVDNAAKRYPDCTFLFGDDPGLTEMQFDFIFSHHVLEHVDDPPAIARLIAKLCAPDAKMLHILPCGNANSFEHRLCRFVKNGIRTEKGNTFFFEEEMHLQRYTSNDLALLFAPHGFHESASWFANQFWGAVAWVSGMNKQFIHLITNYRNAASVRGFLFLFYWRLCFTILYYLRRPYSYYQQLAASQQEVHSLVQKALFRVSLKIKRQLERLSESEWNHKRAFKNGSEMYMLFQRSV